MFPQAHDFGKPSHHVGVVIPIQSEDDTRWIDFAGRKLAEQFGIAHATRGAAGWVGADDEPVVRPAVIVHAYPNRDLTDLDLATLIGVALQLQEALQREGIAVLIDGDAFVI